MTENTVSRIGPSPKVRTPIGAAPVIPVVLIGIGAYLAWFGIHYWGSDTRWPSDPVKAVLQGKAIPRPSGHASAADVAAQVESGSVAAGQGTGAAAPGLGQGVGATPAPPAGDAATNQAAAKLIATSMGHADWTTGQEWADWVALWNQESGWSGSAQNPTSTAYGIAQFLDSTWAAVGGTKTSDVSLQIRYGVLYIAQRYGSPSGAWAHEKANNWY